MSLESVFPSPSPRASCKTQLSTTVSPAWPQPSVAQLGRPTTSHGTSIDGLGLVSLGLAFRRLLHLTASRLYQFPYAGRVEKNGERARPANRLSPTRPAQMRAQPYHPALRYPVQTCKECPMHRHGCSHLGIGAGTGHDLQTLRYRTLSALAASRHGLWQRRRSTMHLVCTGCHWIFVSCLCSSSDRISSHRIQSEMYNWYLHVLTMCICAAVFRRMGSETVRMESCSRASSSNVLRPCNHLPRLPW